MDIGQQQSTGDTTTRDTIQLRSSRSITLDNICTEVTNYIYNIIDNQNEDDAHNIKLLRLALKVNKWAKNLHVDKFLKNLHGLVAEELIELFIEQIVKRYTTEEQRKAFIIQVCDIVLDVVPGFGGLRQYNRLLNKYDTEEYRNTSLRIAAEQGNLDAVKYFVEKGADISVQDEMGYTPLHLAAKQGFLDIVEYLIEKGADVDAYQGGYSYSTALHLAAQNNWLITVKYLIEMGANPNATDSDGKTPLQRAKENGHLVIVEYLTGKGQQVTELPQVTERQQTTRKQEVGNEGGAVVQDALHDAILRDDLSAVKYLLEKGTHVDVRSIGGYTALHFAAIHGKVEIAQLLLNYGADINVQADNGLTPLLIAVNANQTAMVKLLLDHRADINIQFSFRYGNYSSVGHNLGYGFAPLFSAFLNCNTEIAKILLDVGAELSVNGNSTVFLDLANFRKDKCPEMLTLLEDCNIKSSDKSHCPSTTATSSAERTSSFINGLLNWIKNILPQSAIAFFYSRQSQSSCSRYDVLSSLFVSNDIVNWVKGLITCPGSPGLLTSTENSNHTITVVPEINTTVVNNTIILGILAAGIFNKTQHKRQIHENLLSPREQSMRLNNIDNMVIRAIQQCDEKFGGPDTETDEVKISDNKNGMWK